MIKLNVGSAVLNLKGYVNIDLYCDEADKKLDVRDGLPYSNNSVDEILASHFLEHLSYRELPGVLDEFKRVLKDDGVLHIRVPNLLNILSKLEEIENTSTWPENCKRCVGIQEIYGGQWNEGELHKNGFTPKRLCAIMYSRGFEVKQVYPPRDKDPDEINILFQKIK